jgi:hypothetical protein
MVQSTGRHIIHSNVKTLENEFVADVGIGRIQFGPLPGASAEVNVAAWPEGVPAAGISPIPPGTLVAPGVTEAELLLLLQAARAVTLATARASAPMYLFFAKIVIGPSLAALLTPMIRPGVISLSPSFSQFAGEPLRHRGTGSQLPKLVTARARHIAPAHDGPTGQPPVCELAEA